MEDPYKLYETIIRVDQVYWSAYVADVTIAAYRPEPVQMSLEDFHGVLDHLKETPVRFIGNVNIYAKYPYQLFIRNLRLAQPPCGVCNPEFVPVIDGEFFLGVLDGDVLKDIIYSALPEHWREEYTESMTEKILDKMMDAGYILLEGKDAPNVIDAMREIVKEHEHG